MKIGGGMLPTIYLLTACFLPFGDQQVNLKDKLRDFLVFSVLGFLYEGREAWVSIIRDIRGKINRKR